MHDIENLIAGNEVFFLVIKCFNLIENKILCGNTIRYAKENFVASVACFWFRNVNQRV